MADGLRPNHGVMPGDVAGRRIRGVLRNGMAFGAEPVSSSAAAGWLASTTRWSMPLEWPRDLLRQTRGTACAFHMKQLSQAYFPKTYRRFDTFPADLQVRELPRMAA